MRLMRSACCKSLRAVPISFLWSHACLAARIQRPNKIVVVVVVVVIKDSVTERPAKNVWK